MAEEKANPRLGRCVDALAGGEIVRAFVPPPLPPEPPIDVLALLDSLSLAERALGRLDGITMLLPRVYRYRRYLEILDAGTEPLPVGQ